MGKIHVTAIIQALQETIENLSVNGCSVRPKISNPTVDSQYVQALEDDYGDEIDNIVDNIPDDPPAPVLPTVSITGDISVGNWVYPVGGTASLASNATVTVKDNISSGSKIAFNTNVCYAVQNWYINSSNTGTNGSISVANVSNNLGVKNDTNSTLNFYAARIGVCSSNQATVVTVYNSQNNPYNAFQYTIDGTDYYYVLDGTQADWTDDLYSIGYAPTPSITPSIPNETRSFLRIKPVSGKIIYVGQQTRTNVSTSSNSIYDVFSDTDLTIPFDFDYKNKRYVFGYYGDAEQTRYLIYGVNTQDDFPEEAGIYTSYIYLPYAQSSIQCLKNSAQSSRSVSKSLAVQYRSYNDVIVLYFADSQLPTELHAGQEWDTRLKYDSKKTYKATMLINTYNGSKNQRNRIVDFSFFNRYGRLFVKYNGTDYLYPYYECLVFYAANESYFTASGRSGTEDSTLTDGTSLNTLYDKDGQLIPYDSTKVYCIDKIATKDAGRSNANGLAPEIVSVTIDGSAYLALQLSETTDTVAAFVLEYTIATNQ
jgi:hypothetical protein